MIRKRKPRSRYSEWMHGLIIQACAYGCSDIEIAKFLGLGRDTLKRWRDRYPALSMAMQYARLPQHQKGPEPDTAELEEAVAKLDYPVDIEIPDLTDTKAIIKKLMEQK